MPQERRITERFLRTHWQRAMLEDEVFRKVGRAWKAKNPAESITDAALAASEKLRPTSRQSRAIGMAALSLRNWLRYGKRQSINPSKARSSQTVSAVAQKIILESSVQDRDQAFAAARRMIHAPKTRVRPTPFGSSLEVHQDDWPAEFRLRGWASDPLIVMRDEEHRETHQHEFFHRWQEVVDGKYTPLRSEVAAFYFEGTTPKNIARAVISAAYPEAHPLAKVLRVLEERQKAIDAGMRTNDPKAFTRLQIRLSVALNAAGLDAHLTETEEGGLQIEGLAQTVNRERQRLAHHLGRIKALQEKHGLRRSFVSMILKNLHPELAAQVLDYGVHNHPAESLPTTIKRR